MTEPLFLTLAEAIEIHGDVITRYGGLMGVRDYGLLEAALSVPKASFDGRYLHEDIFEMAAAYPFYICRDHPFVDGNKRAALVCALVFLDLNGVIIEDPEETLFGLTTRVASGNADKAEIAGVFRKLAKTETRE